MYMHIIEQYKIHLGLLLKQNNLKELSCSKGMVYTIRQTSDEKGHYNIIY
jgi:hypothetical protein